MMGDPGCNGTKVSFSNSLEVPLLGNHILEKSIFETPSNYDVIIDVQPSITYHLPSRVGGSLGGSLGGSPTCTSTSQP